MSSGSLETTDADAQGQQAPDQRGHACQHCQTNDNLHPESLPKPNHQTNFLHAPKDHTTIATLPAQ